MTMPRPHIPSWSRRRVLQAGALPLLGLDLPRLLAAEASPRDPGRPRRPKSCIFIFQYGGLSQLDSWDPKPDGPSAIRGPYKPIATAVPGFRVGELMPRLARLADRYAVIRSMSHNVPVHDVANRMLLAGQSLPAMTAPSFGAIVSKLRPSRGRRAVARLAAEVRRRGDAPGADLPDRRLPRDGPRPAAGRRRPRRPPGQPGLPGRRLRHARRPHPRSRPGPDATARGRSRPTARRSRPPARWPGSASGPPTSSTGRRPAARSTSTASPRGPRPLRPPPAGAEPAAWPAG